MLNIHKLRVCTCDPQPHSAWRPCSCAPAIQAAGQLGPQDHPRVPASAPGRCPTRLAMGLSHLASLSGFSHVPMARWALLPRQRGRPLPAPLVWIWEGVMQTKRSIAPSCPRLGSRGGWCASDSQHQPPPRPTSAAPFLLTAQCPLVPSSRTLTTHLPHQAPFRAPIAQPLSPGVHPRGDTRPMRCQASRAGVREADDPK